ncbi:ABC transporter permease [Lachnospiraceae bacterium ZAX-1]
MRSFPLTLEKRMQKSTLMLVLNPLLFAMLALAFCGIAIFAMGFSPLDVYTRMIAKAFFNMRGIRKSIIAGLPLMLCGLSVSIAFKMNLSNIGAEGQYAIGAICGGAFALYGPPLPTVLRMIAMFFFCFAGGALWAFLCAMPKAYWNVNETITTLMLNYIALLLLDYLCYGPWKQKGQNVGQSTKISKTLLLPTIPGINISSGFLLAIVLALLIYWFFKYTISGYQISVIKHSPAAAKYAGINIKKYILFVLSISGGFAGIAGFIQITAVLERVQATLTNNSGYTGIIIAYLSNFNPLVVIIVSFLFGGLQNSSATVQVMGVPAEIASMMQGSIMIFVIAGEFFHRYQISRKVPNRHNSDKHNSDRHEPDRHKTGEKQKGGTL